jgi:hypothetical protein
MPTATRRLPAFRVNSPLYISQLLRDLVKALPIQLQCKQLVNLLIDTILIQKFVVLPKASIFSQHPHLLFMLLPIRHEIFQPLWRPTGLDLALLFFDEMVEVFELGVVVRLDGTSLEVDAELPRSFLDGATLVFMLFDQSLAGADGFLRKFDFIGIFSHSAGDGFVLYLDLLLPWLPQNVEV